MSFFLSSSHVLFKSLSFLGGVSVEIAFGEEPKDSYQELVEDLIEIVTSFAGKLYGMRSHRKKKLVDEFKKLLEEVEESERGS